MQIEKYLTRDDRIVLPTGDQLFQCGAIANSGGYCDNNDDSMITQTLTYSNLQLFYNWQDYLQPSSRWSTSRTRPTRSARCPTACTACCRRARLRA